MLIQQHRGVYGWILVVAAVCMTGVSVTIAQDPPPPRADQLAQLLMIRDIILTRYDQDGDGKLNAEEKKSLNQDAKANKEKAKKEFIARFDLDHDGRVSREEFQQMREKMRRMRKVMPKPPLPENDPSNNPGPPLPPHQGGKVDARQVKIVVENSQKRQFAVRPSLFMLAQALILEKYDENLNGRLDPNEVERFVLNSRQLYWERVQELLVVYDSNKDGVLSSEEKQHALEKLKNEKNKLSTPGETLDDIDLFIQETYETELMESLKEGYTLLLEDENKGTR